jgi:hypothetical protein
LRPRLKAAEAVRGPHQTRTDFSGRPTVFQRHPNLFMLPISSCGEKDQIDCQRPRDRRFT